MFMGHIDPRRLREVLRYRDLAVVATILGGCYVRRPQRRRAAR